VPIIGGSGPLGAVVVQRAADRPFSEAEVSLVAALTAPISAGISLARLLDDLRDTPPRRAGDGTRKVTLPGVPVIGGRAMGAVAALRRPATTSRKPGSDADEAALQSALESTERALRALEDRARSLGLGAKFIESYLWMIEDQRLRHTAYEQLRAGASLATALGEVARHAARSASESGDAFLIARARDMEELCDALLMMATPDARATLPAKPILGGETLGMYDLLVSIRAQPVAVALTESQLSDHHRTMLELLAVPAISDVAGAMRWLAPGDIALVDADSGLLIVNPSRADIAALRSERKRERLSRP
jgi:phosphotransferase system enzyme I (PtsP)